MVVILKTDASPSRRDQLLEMFRSKKKNFHHRHQRRRSLGVAMLLMLMAIGFEVSQADNAPSKAVIGETVANAARYGLHPRKYLALTEDGYQLVMYRLKPRISPRGVVLLQHGIRQSSADWLLIKRNLPTQLLDIGFEVWLGNSRASPETTSHDPNAKSSKPFWDFSFHEIGYYDLSAMIDTVLAKSGRKKLHLVGYSEGSTAALSLLSERPSYNAKISSLNLIAPATFMVESEMQQLVAFHSAFREIAPWVPSLQELITGSDEPSINSPKQLEHFQQLLLSGRFRQYDYETWNNQKRYGLDDPPPYALWKITAPVTLHYGTADTIVTPSDVRNLAMQLHESRRVKIVQHDDINHRAFMGHPVAADVVYPRVLSAILEFM